MEFLLLIDRNNVMKIIILMSTYNGEKYVCEQIESLLNQKIKNIKILIRDDGSTDDTCKILNGYQKKYNNINVIYGNNIGVAESFKKLLEYDIDGDYFAFCDQDDVWREDKLENAINSIKKYDSVPAYYYSEVTAVTEELNELFKSNYTGIDTVGSSYNTTPAIGCTVVFNKKLKDIIKNKRLPQDIVMHDLYLYRVCLAIGGKIIHDKNSYIYYRQHESNVVGITNSNIKKMKVYSKYNKTRRKMAKDILEIYDKEISQENYQIIKKIACFNDKLSFFEKLKIIFDKNYNSKKIKSNLKFFYDIIFNNI